MAAQQVKIGVYLDDCRRTAVVLRATDGRVTYLSMNQTKLSVVNGKRFYETTSQSVDLTTCSESAFAEQFTVRLPQYPILHAIKKYWTSGLFITDHAKQAMKVAAKNLMKAST